MNLYIRLLILLFKLPFIKQDSDVLTPTLLPMHVWPNDLDFNFHMNNGRYLTLMDLGRFHLLAKKGLLSKVFKRKWQPVLGGAKIHFIKALGPFSRFNLKTEVLYWDEKWIYIEQHFIQNNQLMATAMVKALFVHKGKRLKPESLFELISQTPPTRPACPVTLQHWLDSEKKAKAHRD